MNGGAAFVVAVAGAVAFLFMAGTTVQDAAQNTRIEQLTADRNTSQQQIADLQRTTRELSGALQQTIADQRAAGAASVTATTCTLHDIAVQNPGC